MRQTFDIYYHYLLNISSSDGMSTGWLTTVHFPAILPLPLYEHLYMTALHFSGGYNDTPSREANRQLLKKADVISSLFLSEEMKTALWGA